MLITVLYASLFLGTLHIPIFFFYSFGIPSLGLNITVTGVYILLGILSFTFLKSGEETWD